MNKYEKDRSFEHAVVYILIKNKEFTDVSVGEIIYMADIHHLLVYNSVITGKEFMYVNSYELSENSIHKMMHKKNQLLAKYKKEDELNCLTDTAKQSLDFAITRYKADYCILPDRISKKNA